MTFADFLRLLVAFGPKLKDIWPDLLALIASAKSIIEKLGGPKLEDGVLAVQSVTAEEEELLGAIAENVAGSTALFDPTVLLSLIPLFGHQGPNAGSWAFFVSGLITAVLEALKKQG